MSANQDFADIARYITRESASVTVGRAFIGRLRNKCQKLAELPGVLGQARSELGADIRSTSVQTIRSSFGIAATCSRSSTCSTRIVTANNSSVIRASSH